MSFAEVFGGSNIYPSQTTYLAIDPLAVNTLLAWPVEQAVAGDLVVADIMDINATAPGLSVQMPDARQAPTGFSVLVNNIGGNTFSVLDSTGGLIVSIAAGTVWELYIRDNSTAAGLWRIFQFGASVSVAVASALAGAGLKAIGTTLNERMTIVARAVNYVVVNADRANVQQWTSGVGTFTLPDPATVGSDWFTILKNSGTGNLTVTPAAGLIDGVASLTLAPGASAWVVTDGVGYYSLAGSGSSSGGSGFNLLTIDVSGTGNFILAGAQLNQIGYKFTGVLTGNRAIIVPGTTQEYWVDNETTGAFTLQVQTLGQVSPAPPVIPTGARNILYCDGTSVVAAESATVSFPIAVLNGGTGATTAANARTNLGGTATGVAVFTAASVAAAQAALSVPPNSRLISTGQGLTGGGDLSADRTIATDWTYVIKPANTDRASTTAFTADPDLVLAFLANKYYEVEMNLCFAEPTAGTGSVKYCLGYSGAIGLNAGQNVGVVVAAAGSLSNQQQTMSISTGVPIVGPNLVTPGVVGSSVYAKFVYSPQDNSNLTLYWGQNLSDPAATRLTKGSYMKARLLV